VREALKAKAEGKETVIVFNNCGHGFLDLAAYENYLAGKLEDLDLEQGKIDAALGDLPRRNAGSAVSVGSAATE
jgi:tryptophan synthase beta chain